MASTERNALAELAEELKTDARIMYAHNRIRDRICKAQRIVAELAKVEYLTCDGAIVSTILSQANHAVIKCRAIAEEGGSK